MKQLREFGTPRDLIRQFVHDETDAMTQALARVDADQVTERQDFRIRNPRARTVVMAREVRLVHGTMMHERRPRRTR